MQEMSSPVQQNPCIKVEFASDSNDSIPPSEQTDPLAINTTDKPLPLVGKDNKFFQAIKKKASCAQLVVWKGAQNEPSEEVPLEEGNLFILGNSRVERSDKSTCLANGSKNPLRSRNTHLDVNKSLHGVSIRRQNRRKKSQRGFKWLNKREYDFLVKNLLSQRQRTGNLDGMVVLSQNGSSSSQEADNGAKRYIAVVHEDELLNEVANFENIDDCPVKRGIRRQSNCIKDANGDIITDQTGKPLCTYTELIEKALRDTGGLTVSEIYNWISNHYPFFQSNDDRWKNSIRHNLSINPYFMKGEKARNGSGHLWMINEEGRGLKLPYRRKSSDPNDFSMPMDSETDRAVAKILGDYNMARSRECRNIDEDYNPNMENEEQIDLPEPTVIRKETKKDGSMVFDCSHLPPGQYEITIPRDHSRINLEEAMKTIIAHPHPVEEESNKENLDNNSNPPLEAIVVDETETIVSDFSILDDCSSTGRFGLGIMPTMQSSASCINDIIKGSNFNPAGETPFQEGIREIKQEINLNISHQNSGEIFSQDMFAIESSPSREFERSPNGMFPVTTADHLHLLTQQQHLIDSHEFGIFPAFSETTYIPNGDPSQIM